MHRLPKDGEKGKTPSVQKLMRDSRSPEAERRVQLTFRKFSIFSYLALTAIVLAGAELLRLTRPPLDLASGTSAVEWNPAAAEPVVDPRARLAGAWRLRAADSRIGGISGLAIEGGRLLALTDGGMLVRLPRPPGAGTAAISPLPTVAGDPARKIGRDSEALMRDPDGRGWWVAFEQRHQLILYDQDFRRAIRAVPIADPGFRDNRGIEALSGARGVTWHPEASGIADAATLDDGTVLLLRRRFGLGGFEATVDGLSGGPLRLPLRGLDNAEGLAAEMLEDGTIRLWIVTDNDFSRRRRTLLVAVDLRQAAAAAD